MVKQIMKDIMVCGHSSAACEKVFSFRVALLFYLPLLKKLEPKIENIVSMLITITNEG